MSATGAGRDDFEREYRELYPLVVRTVYLTLFDRDAAQEITHEAFLRLWQHWGKLGDQGSIKAWLMKVALNLAIDQRRTLLTALKVRLMPATIRDPAEAALDRLDRRRLRRALLALPSRDRAVLALRFEQDLSFPEIGRIMGRPEATVKTWVHRALDQLERRLNGPEGDLIVKEA